MQPKPAPAPSDTDGEERRPTSVLLVYTWDLVRAILVFFVAFAAFGGATDVSGKTVQLSTPVQIFLALSSAALGAVLLLLGMLLTRHYAWIRRAQITVLAMMVGIGLLSFAVVQWRSGFHVEQLAGTLLLALIDLLALVAMTGHRVTAWYRDPGPVPFYIGSLVAFWAAVSAAYIVIEAFS
ncbi:MAG TPA: hypothetical protein VGQ42_07255 [Candidatus Dormibacteraeota bacterium]|jgi:hypothetical protein|nr:hypothetical protein [Candidatus Dormibacteraeota bacterium]